MKNHVTWLMALTALMVIASTACQAASTPAVGGKIWVLQSIQQQDVLQGTLVTATFDRAKGLVSGSAGCNSYFGDYELRGSRLLIVGPIGQTEMWCETPAGVMEQEQRYLTVLAAAETLELAGDQVRISCSGGRVLTFSAK